MLIRLLKGLIYNSVAELRISDQIRDALKEAGFEVNDTKDGVTWRLNK